MARRGLLAGLAGLLIISGCAGRAAPRLIRAPEPLEEPEPYEIAAYQGQDQGNEMPAWLDVYLEKGLRGLESLAEYRQKYVFVAQNSGTNSRLLKQWAENFSPAQDFARLAAARIEARLSAAATAYPDDEYGLFFEMAVKAASDNAYQGAVKEDDYWILRRYPGGEETGIRESFEFFILVSIDKSLFESQVNAILNRLNPAPPAGKEQTEAFNRVKENFFDGF